MTALVASSIPGVLAFASVQAANAQCEFPRVYDMQSFNVESRAAVPPHVDAATFADAPEK